MMIETGVELSETIMELPLYNNVRRDVALLSYEEKLRLMEDLAEMIRQQGRRLKHSILELEGLGAEHWKGVDAQEFVDRERESWNG